jgi:hypothetical protein
MGKKAWDGVERRHNQRRAHERQLAESQPDLNPASTIPQIINLLSRSIHDLQQLRRTVQGALDREGYQEDTRQLLAQTFEHAFRCVTQIMNDLEVLNGQFRKGSSSENDD